MLDIVRSASCWVVSQFVSHGSVPRGATDHCLREEKKAPKITTKTVVLADGTYGLRPQSQFAADFRIVGT